MPARAPAPASSDAKLDTLKRFSFPKGLWKPASLVFQAWLYLVPLLVPLYLAGCERRAELVYAAVALSVLFSSALNLSHHRYFSHSSFKLSIPAETVLALVGTMCTVQRGPLWWASKHKEHHAFCDTPKDPMSRRQDGFLHAHSLWISVPENLKIRWHYIEAMAKRNPALVWIEALSLVLAQVPSLIGLALGGWPWYWTAVLGQALSLHWEFGTNSISHGTSFDQVPAEHREAAERNGCIPLDTWILGLLSGGEGFHAAHHTDPLCARAGTKWWQPDIVYGVICALERAGVAHAVRHRVSAP